MVNRVVVLLDCKRNHHRWIADMVSLALNVSFLHVFERQEWSYCVTARWNQWKAGEFWLRRATTSGQWAALLVLTADCVVTLLQAKVLFIYKDGKCCFAKVLSVWAAVGCHLAGPSGWRWLPTADQASACCGKATSSEFQGDWQGSSENSSEWVGGKLALLDPTTLQECCNTRKQ